MQHLGERLGRRVEAKTLPWRVIVEKADMIDLLGRKGVEIRLAREPATQPADRVLDATFLPGRVRVAEERLNAKRLAKRMVQSEFGAVVESDGSTQGLWQRGQQLPDGLGHGGSLFAGLSHYCGPARGTFMHGQEGLA